DRREVALVGGRRISRRVALAVRVQLVPAPVVRLPFVVAFLHHRRIEDLVEHGRHVLLVVLVVVRGRRRRAAGIAGQHLLIVALLVVRVLLVTAGVALDETLDELADRGLLFHGEHRTAGRR